MSRFAMGDTILIIEDEADVGNLVRYNLAKAGFSVLVATDGSAGLESARKNRPDAIILDLMLPGLDGQTICKALKQDPACPPILMLTAKGEPEDRIKGFEIGADDYVTKPFSPRELVLRVQALLRRAHASTRDGLLEVDDFVIDKGAFDARLGGRRLPLTTTEFKLLTLLIERRPRTQSRETLLGDVWGYRNTMDTRTVDTHVRRLREKLESHADRLETVRGEGYRFTPAAP